MKRALLFSCLLLVALSLTGCDSIMTFMAGEEGRDENGKFLTRTAWSGDFANAQSRNFVVARSQGEWEALWAQVQEPMPGNLPSGKMAIAILAGEKPSYGYRVEILEARPLDRFTQDERVTVTYHEYDPSPYIAQADLAAQAGTRVNTRPSPWAIRLVDTTPLMPRFERN